MSNGKQSMWRSNRVELMAIPMIALLTGGLFLVFAVSTIGPWGWVVTGLGILGLIVLAVRRFALRHAHPAIDDVSRSFAPRDEGPHRILVVIDDRSAPAAIRDAVAVRAQGGASEVFVVAPVGGSRLDRLTGDETAYATATRHLDATLDELAMLSDLDVREGKLGSHDPIQATDEGLREFAADEILFMVAGYADGHRPRARAVDIAPSRYEIPVTITRLASSRE
jgi:hypothetical protein